MLIFHNAQHALHQPRQEMFRGRLVPCVELPARADIVERELRQRGLTQWRTPGEPDLALIESVHAPAYVQFLRSAWDQWTALDAANAAFDVLPSIWPNPGLRRDVSPRNFSAQVGLYAFDAGSPITAGTWAAAANGAACAIDAARAVVAGEPHALVLTRPPGHHAGADFYGGYCFLNNAALAAQAMRDAGLAKVAILDVDYHHGNGTQSIFDERSDVFTASLHGDPDTEYPFYLGYADERGTGAGEGANLNLPLPRGTGFAEWQRALARAMEAVAASGAKALVVPLGVDTFEGDPISGFGLRSADFLAMGRQLASLRLPMVLVLEGGYAVEAMGVNVANVVEGVMRGS
jgi:acetoin utilization deacetylase AcuC-like enzyme